MTIAVGCVSDDNIVIGTDSRWSWDENFVREHATSKFLEVPHKYRNHVLIASAGQDKFTQIFYKLIKRTPAILDFTDYDGILDLVENLQMAVKDFGVGDPDSNQLPEHNMGFLIGSTKTRSLWVVESDYGVTEFKDHVCIGSGTFLGESSMLTLRKLNIFGERAVKTAIETVNALHPYCGGKIEVRSLTLK